MVNRTICAWALIVMAPMALAATAGPKSFASPEAAIAGLVDAVKLNDQPMLNGILGSHGSKLTSSGDEVADRQNREAFLKAYRTRDRYRPTGRVEAWLCTIAAREAISRLRWSALQKRLLDRGRRHAEESALPSGLGRIGAEGRSEPLAVVQLLLLFHLFQARGPDRAMAAASVPR